MNGLTFQQPLVVWCVIYIDDGNRELVESIWSTQDLAESAADVARAEFKTFRFFVRAWEVDFPPAYQKG